MGKLTNRARQILPENKAKKTVISVIIPAYHAESTLLRAVTSVQRQSLSDWQAVIVSDDGVDYRAVLAAQGVNDPRLIFASTGGVGTGCHNARNAGFPLATGDYVTQLDADDEFTPTRFAELMLLAERYGAAADNLLMIDEETEAPIGTVLGEIAETWLLTLGDFMRLNAPLVPLIRCDHVLSRENGIEFSEDVIANIQLINRINTLPVTPSSSYIYRIRQGSVANSDASVKKFDEGYAAYIARLESGDGFAITPENRNIARDGLNAKRRLNLAYADAQKHEPSLTFSEFAKR